jgi:hypothetical protein
MVIMVMSTKVSVYFAVADLLLVRLERQAGRRVSQLEGSKRWKITIGMTMTRQDQYK